MKRQELKEIKAKYLELLIYSLEMDYKQWTKEETEYYIRFHSPKYSDGYLSFEYKPGIGVLVNIKYSTYGKTIKLKSYNPWSKKRKLQNRLIHYLKNKDKIDKKASDISSHNSVIDMVEKELKTKPEYIQFSRSNKLNRILDK